MILFVYNCKCLCVFVCVSVFGRVRYNRQNKLHGTQSRRISPPILANIHRHQGNKICSLQWMKQSEHLCYCSTDKIKLWFIIIVIIVMMIRYYYDSIVYKASNTFQHRSSVRPHISLTLSLSLCYWIIWNWKEFSLNSLVLLRTACKQN